MKAQTLAVCAVIACAIQCFGTEEDSLPTYTGISGTGSAVVHIRARRHVAPFGAFATTYTVGPVNKGHGKARRLGATQGSRRALSERTTDRWVDVDRLMSPDPGINQQLGQAVAMWQDEALVVGAVGDDFDGSWSGSAEVYRWDPPKSGWALEGVLRPSQKESTVNDRFGGAVAIGKRYAVVGAALDDTNGVRAGAAYLFLRRQRTDQNATWSQKLKLLPARGGAGELFGSAISMDGSRVLVGGPGGKDSEGRVVMFELERAVRPQAELKPRDSLLLQNGYGCAVALSGAWAIVGASVVGRPSDPTNSTEPPTPGRAVLFHLARGRWKHAQELFPPDRLDVRFGQSVALGDAHAAVGAHNVVHLFGLSEGQWVLQQSIQRPQGTGGVFGSSLSMSNDRLAAGAWHAAPGPGDACGVDGWCASGSSCNSTDLRCYEDCWPQAHRLQKYWCQLSVAGLGERCERTRLQARPTRICADERLCIARTCTDMDCTTNEWQPWSACSQMCGGGKQHRLRTVRSPGSSNGSPCGGLFEDQRCNTHSCARALPGFTQIFDAPRDRRGLVVVSTAPQPRNETVDGASIPQIGLRECAGSCASRVGCVGFAYHQKKRECQVVDSLVMQRTGRDDASLSFAQLPRGGVVHVEWICEDAQEQKAVIQIGLGDCDTEMSISTKSSTKLNPACGLLLARETSQVYGQLMREYADHIMGCAQLESAAEPLIKAGQAMSRVKLVSSPAAKQRQAEVEQLRGQAAMVVAAAGEMPAQFKEATEQASKALQSASAAIEGIVAAGAEQQLQQEEWLCPAANEHSATIETNMAQCGAALQFVVKTRQDVSAWPSECVRELRGASAATFGNKLLQYALNLKECSETNPPSSSVAMKAKQLDSTVRAQWEVERMEILQTQQDAMSDMLSNPLPDGKGGLAKAQADQTKALKVVDEQQIQIELIRKTLRAKKSIMATAEADLQLQEKRYKENEKHLEWICSEDGSYSGQLSTGVPPGCASAFSFDAYLSTSNPPEPMPPACETEWRAMAVQQYSLGLLKFADNIKLCSTMEPVPQEVHDAFEQTLDAINDNSKSEHQMQAERLVEQTSELSEWIAQQADQLANSVSHAAENTDAVLAAAQESTAGVSKAKELMEEANRMSAEKPATDETDHELGYLVSAAQSSGSSGVTAFFLLPKLQPLANRSHQVLIPTLGDIQFSNQSNHTVHNNSNSSNVSSSSIEISVEYLDVYSWVCSSDRTQTAQFEKVSADEATCSSMMTFNSQTNMYTTACQHEYRVESIKRAAQSMMHFKDELAKCSTFVPVPEAVGAAAWTARKIQKESASASVEMFQKQHQQELGIVSSQYRCLHAQKRVDIGMSKMISLLKVKLERMVSVQMSLDCTAQPCDCIVTEWKPWSRCTKSCGSGRTSRTRLVRRANNRHGQECPVLAESRVCNTRSCETNVECQDDNEKCPAMKHMCNVTGSVIRMCPLTCGNCEAFELEPFEGQIDNIVQNSTSAGQNASIELEIAPIQISDEADDANDFAGDEDEDPNESDEDEDDDDDQPATETEEEQELDADESPGTTLLLDLEMLISLAESNSTNSSNSSNSSHRQHEQVEVCTSSCRDAPSFASWCPTFKQYCTHVKAWHWLQKRCAKTCGLCAETPVAELTPRHKANLAVKAVKEAKQAVAAAEDKLVVSEDVVLSKDANLEEAIEESKEARTEESKMNKLLRYEQSKEQQVEANMKKSEQRLADAASIKKDADLRAAESDAIEQQASATADQNLDAPGPLEIKKMKLTEKDAVQAIESASQYRVDDEKAGETLNAAQQAVQATTPVLQKAQAGLVEAGRNDYRSVKKAKKTRRAYKQARDEMAEAGYKSRKKKSMLQEEQKMLQEEGDMQNMAIQILQDVHLQTQTAICDKDSSKCMRGGICRETGGFSPYRRISSNHSMAVHDVGPNGCVCREDSCRLDGRHDTVNGSGINCMLMGETMLKDAHGSCMCAIPTDCQLGANCFSILPANTPYFKAVNGDCSCKGRYCMKDNKCLDTNGVSKLSPWLRNNNGTCECMPGADCETSPVSAPVGAVYVYSILEGTWQLEATLKASVGSASDLFGFSAAMGIQQLAVGAPGDSVSMLKQSGAVHVFEVASCGDGQRHPLEQCDDGNSESGDGCSDTCVLEDGWECKGGSRTQQDACSTICQDSRQTGTEACDDGNDVSGDGCDPLCQVELGWSCFGGSPVSASECDQCGNGHKRGSETCDDGNLDLLDGCDSECRVEPGFVCGKSANSTSLCWPLQEYFNDQFSKRLQRNRRHCAFQEPKQAFEMLDMSSVEGQCVPFPEKSFCEAGEQTSAQANMLLEGSALSDPNVAISSDSIHLTTPTNISTGKHNLMAFAVCQEALDLVCQKTSTVDTETGVTSTESSCMQQRNVRCLEVATETSFCSIKNKDTIKGRVVSRAFGPGADSLGEVCIFDRCVVPESWITAQRVRRKPSDWCQLVEDAIPDVDRPPKPPSNQLALDEVELLQIDQFSDPGFDAEVLSLNGAEADPMPEDPTRRRRGSWKAQLDAAAAAATTDPSKPASGVYGTEKSSNQFWDAEDDGQNEQNKTKIFEVAAEVQKREIVALEQEDYTVNRESADAQNELQQKMAQEKQFKQKAEAAAIAPPAPPAKLGLSDHEKRALRRLSYAKAREVRFKRAAQEAMLQGKQLEGKALMFQTQTEAAQKAAAQAKQLSSKQDTLQELQVEIKQQITSKELLQKDSLKLNQTAEQLKATNRSRADELHRLLYSPKDCKVTAWSPLSHCNQKCGIGIKTRQREVLRNATNGGAECPLLKEEYNCITRECDVCGDGLQSVDEQCDDGNLRPADGCGSDCRVESGFHCAGGSVASTSICEECGNGFVGSTEECDDGNSQDGDGCSSDCGLEKHFVCFGGSVNTSSTCLPSAKFQTEWRERVASEMWKCNSQPNKTMAFVMDSLPSGEGHCEDIPELSQLDNDDVGRIVTSQHGTLATDVAAVSSRTTILTPPVSLESVQDANGLPGVEPYAVCESNIVKVCFTEALSGKIRQRTCLTQGNGFCREVVVEERFCDAKESISHGARRAFRKHEDPRGRTVCVFSGCRTPSSWINNEGAGIEPAAWCKLPTLNSIQ